MDLVSGKSVQGGLLGFFIGATFHLARGLDDRRLARREHLASSPPHSTPLSSPSTLRLLRESLFEGYMTGRTLFAAAFVAGTIGFLEHGRDSSKLYNAREDPLALGAGIATGVYLFVDNTIPSRQRAMSALVYGVGAAGLGLLLKRQRGGEGERRLEEVAE